MGRTLVPGVWVFFPEGPLEAPAVAAAAAAVGVQGDRGLLLGAAGDGGLVVLGLGVLMGGEREREIERENE